MAKLITTSGILKASKVKRKGVHAKTKSSKNKNSKNYKKPYVGQG
jgi:hypothetical protein